MGSEMCIRDRPLIDDGQEIDPFVSVPIAISTNPEATATADPELDPHGLYLLFST